MCFVCLLTESFSLILVLQHTDRCTVSPDRSRWHTALKEAMESMNVTLCQACAWLDTCVILHGMTFKITIFKVCNL